MISKSLSTSERWARLVDVAGELAEFCQSFYPLLVAHSDDFGRLPGDVHTVKHLVIPASPRNTQQVSTALQYLHDVNLIVLYDTARRTRASQKVIQIVDFDEHQSGLGKRTKSKFLEPPGNFTEIQELPAQLNLSELKRTEQKEEQEKRTAASPPLFSRRVSHDGRTPADNYRQIVAIVHKEILPTGVRDISELEEATKGRCAKLRIAYDSEVVRKAVESALHPKPNRRPA